MNDCIGEMIASAEVDVDPNWRLVPPEFKVEVNPEVEVDPKVMVDSEFKAVVCPEFKVDVAPEVKVEVAPKFKVEDREFSFLLTVQDSPLYRRSSSLKASPTPPGAPHQRKAVRFADALGLDLESVRHILNSTEPPIVPISATQDLNLNFELDRNDPKATPHGEVPRLSACFSDPSTSSNFEREVLERKVRLANCSMDSVGMTVEGTVWVSNFTYEKAVMVRYTTNAWVTFSDVEARFISGSGDGRTDYFRFVLELGDYFSIGSRMEFSVRLTCEGETFWDSNDGGNYRVECCVDLSC